MNTADHTDARQCTATAKGSRQRCKRRPIPGGTVCVKHGGGAPQVQAAARIRLAALVEPAIDRLTKLLKAKQEGVQLGAVKDVLDRNGFKPKEHVTLEGELPVRFTLNLGHPRT